MRRPRRSKHQKEIMGLVLKATNEGQYLTQGQIQPLLSYGTEVTHGAIRETIASLVSTGMLVKEVGPGNCRHLVPTLLGYDWYRTAR